MKVVIYSDGSCDHRSRLGGAGFYMICKEYDQEAYFSRGYKDTTISRMEGMALYQAIRSMSKDLTIELTVYSDSQYITKSFTEHRLDRWKLSNFVGVANVDMWRGIIHQLELHPLLKLTMEHVRGHQIIGDDHSIGNAIADSLADYRIHKEYHTDKFEA